MDEDMKKVLTEAKKHIGFGRNYVQAAQGHAANSPGANSLRLAMADIQSAENWIRRFEETQDA